MSEVRMTATLPVPPHAALRDAVRMVVAELEAAGRSDLARRLDEAMAAWWQEEREWAGAVARQLSVHHDINNALVGVRGNTQLLMMGPVVATPGVRERLDVVLRESDRIREAAQRLNALKIAITTLSGEGVTEVSPHAA